MRTSNYYLLIFSFILFSCFQCSDNKLKIKNNSSKNITVYYSKVRDVHHNISEFYYSQLTRIPPHSIEAFYTQNNTWRNIFEGSEGAMVTFCIFDTYIFKNKNLKESRELLMNKALCIKKYELSIEELDKMNWTIDVRLNDGKTR